MATNRPGRPKATRISQRNATDTTKKAWKDALPTGFKSYDAMTDSLIEAKPQYSKSGSNQKDARGKATTDSTSSRKTPHHVPKKTLEDALPNGFKSHDDMTASSTETKEYDTRNVNSAIVRPKITYDSKKNAKQKKHIIKSELNYKHSNTDKNYNLENGNSTMSGRPERVKRTTHTLDSLLSNDTIAAPFDLKQESMPTNALRITLMNADSSEKPLYPDPPGRRRHLIHNVIQKARPDIVLFQEFVWKGVTGKLWENYPIPSHYTYTGHAHASILYNHNKITVYDIPAAKLDALIAKLQRSSMDFTPIPRMCMKKVTFSTKTFIVISWHGLNNNPSGRGKMQEAKKIEYFEYLMEFLRNLREKYILPILIGGDFNVDIQHIKYIVQAPFRVCLYDASKRRTDKAVLDFFITTEEIETSDITWFDLAKETDVVCPLEVLDHDPVSANVKIEPFSTDKYYPIQTASRAHYNRTITQKF